MEDKFCEAGFEMSSEKGWVNSKCRSLVGEHGTGGGLWKMALRKKMFIRTLWKEV